MFPTWPKIYLPKSARADFGWRSGGGRDPHPIPPLFKGREAFAAGSESNAMARSRLGGLLEMLQYAGPAAVDVLAHFFAGLRAHLLELAVLELDPRRVLPVGPKPHLDLGAHVRVRLPAAVDVPAHHEAVRRLPHQNFADVGAGAVLAD